MKPHTRTLVRSAALVVLPPCRHFAATSVVARKPARKRASASASLPSVPKPEQPNTPANTYYHFRVLVQRHFQALVRQLTDSIITKPELLRSFGLTGPNDLSRNVKNFTKTLEASFNLAVVGDTSRATNPLFWALRHGFVRGNAGGLVREITYAFRSFTGHSKYTSAMARIRSGLADFRHPVEWFPATRAMQRTVHLHVGPTNSGKTYNALKALEAANTGVYAGPLRLLAHEVYSRLLAKDRNCALLTGEEQRIPEKLDRLLSSCTVEMTPLNTRVDVAVIDEIQMIGDRDRGFAWTQAFLGVQAREVHLCGEERTVDLVQKLCAMIGEKCVVHRYKRLSPLQTMRQSLSGDFSNLRKGDAVVSFSRVNLHALKVGIEKQTGKRCAVVYGSLPPETRAEQASLFNDPDNEYDYIVASDAIGMGLNLEIKRVVFDAVSKFDGMTQRLLTIPEIRQIGGRAGRFRTAAQAIKDKAGQKAEDVVALPPPPPSPMPAPAPKESSNKGLVTCMDKNDMEHVHKAFAVEPPPLKAAGILPPAAVLERLFSYFPKETPLSHVILKVREMAQLSDLFFLCDIDGWIETADAIQEYPMAVYDRCIFLTAPVCRDSMPMLKKYAKCVSDLKGGALLEIEELDLEMLDEDPDDWAKRPREYFDRMEKLHKAITMYLWLSYRYAGVFTSQRLAFHVKALVEARISEQLEKVDYRPERRAQRVKAIRNMMKRQQEADAMLLPELANGDGDDAALDYIPLPELVDGEGGETGPMPQ